MVDRLTKTLAAAASFLIAGEAAAQQISRPTGSIEATTDHRRRGISWTDGKPAIDAMVSVPLPSNIRADVRATTLRGSARHRDADLVVDGSLGYTLDVASGLTLTGGGTMHLFTGAEGRADYGEIDARLGYALGPAQLDLSASYAPDQNSIGGDNLYLQAQVSGGIPVTGINVAAHIGRTTGGTDDPIRAARLRPGGDYTDWGVRVEQAFGPIALGVRYSGNSIDTDRINPSPFANMEDAGDRVTAHVAVFF
jgi:uncharacterized protein (TIGR02001 family)